MFIFVLFYRQTIGWGISDHHTHAEVKWNFVIIKYVTIWWIRYTRTFYLFGWLSAKNKVNRDIEFIMLCKKFTYSFFKYFIGKPERNKPDHPDYVPSIFVYKSVKPSLSEKKMKRYEAVMKRRKAGANCSSKVSSNDNSKISLLLFLYLTSF